MLKIHFGTVHEISYLKISDYYIYCEFLSISTLHIKTHDSESRGQEEAAVRDE